MVYKAHSHGAQALAIGGIGRAVLTCMAGAVGWVSHPAGHAVWAQPPVLCGQGAAAVLTSAAGRPSGLQLSGGGNVRSGLTGTLSKLGIAGSNRTLASGIPALYFQLGSVLPVLASRTTFPDFPAKR